MFSTEFMLQLILKNIRKTIYIFDIIELGTLKNRYNLMIHSKIFSGKKLEKNYQEITD